jgi:hypothetical protein
VLLLAGAGALVLTLWMRSQLPGWVLLPLALAAAFLPPLLSKDLRYVDVHGFLHASYVYALMNRGLPPEDVLMAGEPLRYPWAQHYLTALVCRAAAVSPADVFLATNAAALLGTLGFVAGTSRLIDKDRRTTVCAVLLALVGTSVFHAGPLQGWINHLPKVRLDERVVPLHKYTLANGNPLGFLGFSAFLYLAVKVFSTGRITAREWVGLALAVAFLGYFYPIAWMALLAAASAICVAHGIRTRAPRLSAAVGAAVIAGSACAAIRGGHRQRKVRDRRRDAAPDAGVRNHQPVQRAVRGGAAGGGNLAATAVPRGAVERAPGGDHHARGGGGGAGRVVLRAVHSHGEPV